MYNVIVKDCVWDRKDHGAMSDAAAEKATVLTRKWSCPRPVEET